LKKGRHGITKTAYKKMLKERGRVPVFIDEKIIETDGISDWNRSTKIDFSINLMESADEDLVFPPRIMKKINKSQLQPVTALGDSDHGVVWFCIQSIEERTTKNGKIFYRMKVCDNDFNSRWLRVWSKFRETPDLYTMWLAEVKNSAAWGSSTSSYKMKKIDV